MLIQEYKRRLRDIGQDFGMRAAMARSTAPYCHPQLQAVAHKLVDEKGNLLAPVVNLTASTPKLGGKMRRLMEPEGGSVSRC
jgi:hypothetical protein